MERKDEKSYLLCGRPIYEAVRINVSKLKIIEDENVEDFRYYTAPPLWIKVRLCLFWTLWIALILSLLTSVCAYYCVAPFLCANLRQYAKANTAHILNGP